MTTTSYISSSNGTVFSQRMRYFGGSIPSVSNERKEDLLFVTSAAIRRRSCRIEDTCWSRRLTYYNVWVTKRSLLRRGVNGDPLRTGLSRGRVVDAAVCTIYNVLSSGVGPLIW
jgi:hypothetical protein